MSKARVVPGPATSTLEKLSEPERTMMSSAPTLSANVLERVSGPPVGSREIYLNIANNRGKRFPNVAAVGTKPNGID